MDIERPPHRTTSTPTTTSELFICFTSRLTNSSSMRLSSKSILSPGRTGDKSTNSLSLSSSLSRRLRHNGSLKGGQSPAMFTSKKNRGSAGFENPEPSSPKVTCIGQVRVKTKKQGKKMKMRACRSKRLSGGEASFRRIEHAHEGLTHQNSQGIQNNNNGNGNNQQDCSLPHRNQRWVHLPLTICEALRTFGSEFSCLLPCKSSCFSSCNNNEREKEEKRDGVNNNNNNDGHSVSSCGAVFRWLVAMQEGEGKERDIELVVGDEERESRERMAVMERECSRRRSIFDDMEFEDEMFDVRNENNNNGDDENEVAARVSVCVPPKNALLLMRCRSDPVKMSALSHKIWEAPVVKDYDDYEDDEVEEKVEEKQEKGDEKERFLSQVEEKIEVVSEEREKLGEVFKDEVDEMCEDLGLVEENVEGLEMGSQDLGVSIEKEGEKPEETGDEKTEEKQSTEEEETGEKQSIEEQETEEKQSIEEKESQSMEDENEVNGCSSDVVLVEEKLEDGEKEQALLKEEREREESSDLSSSLSSICSSSSEESTAESKENQSEEEEKENDVVEEDQENVAIEEYQEMVKSKGEEEKEEKRLTLTRQRSDPTEPEKTGEERENNKPEGLPDCLLLMMCEPKLSMEVSKETWVCSTDFIRWLPERHANKKSNKIDGSDEVKKKKKAPPALPPQPAGQMAGQPAVQPGRSSISFPAAKLIEQKLVKAGGGVAGYEPFVLTRCKSAPIRSTAKIAGPDMACSLWGRENSRRKMEPHRPAAFGV